MEPLRERIREVIIQVLRDNRHVDPSVDAILKAVDDDRAPEVERHYSIAVLATDIIDGRDQKLAKSEAREAALRVYCRHFPDCPLAQWSQGRPTKDGGYETMYAGKWYQGDDKPACTCGLDAVLAVKE